MKISVTTLTFTSVVGFAAGFAPSTAPKIATSLNMANKKPAKKPYTSKAATSNSATSTKAATSPNVTKYPEVNGWTADPDKFCAGLPGSVAPFREFDPLGLISGFSVEEIKRYRESEVTHGRVAMLASLGYLVGESFHPFFGGVVSGPANSHLAQVQNRPHFLRRLDCRDWRFRALPCQDWLESTPKSKFTACYSISCYQQQALNALPYFP